MILGIEAPLNIMQRTCSKAASYQKEYWTDQELNPDHPSGELGDAWLWDYRLCLTMNRVLMFSSNLILPRLLFKCNLLAYFDLRLTNVERQAENPFTPHSRAFHTHSVMVCVQSSACIYTTSEHFWVWVNSKKLHWDQKFRTPPFGSSEVCLDETNGNCTCTPSYNICLYISWCITCWDICNCGIS